MVLASRRPVSLTSRLVGTVVLLVLAVTIIAGAVTAFAVNRYLTERLDDEVLAALGRGQADDGTFGDRPPPGQSVGTLTAILPSAESSLEPVGTVLEQGDAPRAEREDLSSTDLGTIADQPDDGVPRDVDLPDLGHYRVAVVRAGDGEFAAGLPTSDREDVFRTLLAWELALLVVSGLGAVGLGTLLVRRQLRPLREVAATAHQVAGLPLATDEVDLRDRVPAHLRDERTEVGQVGAALSGLLTHVGTSLEARRRSEEQVRRFVADASHELRTPLTTIGGYVQLARRRGDAEATETALTKVEEESARMTRLVEDLLLLARLDAGRPLEQETVDVTRLLLEAVSDAKVVAGDHRWRLDLPDDELEVVGDEMRLHQVVTNLLTNARKYTPPGSTVTAAARRDGDSVVVRVHDDGPGFDPDAAAHAFERFARGDPARQREGGAGLGLALVDAIVAAHHGRVELDSDPGDTTLRVVLPVRGAAGPTATT